MPNTLEELRKENPALATALMAEVQAAVSSEIGTTSDAVEAERKRLMEIDEVSALFDDETVREAKYGENPCTAQEMSYRAAQKAVKELQYSRPVGWDGCMEPILNRSAQKLRGRFRIGDRA